MDPTPQPSRQEVAEASERFGLDLHDDLISAAQGTIDAVSPSAVVDEVRKEGCVAVPRAWMDRGDGRAVPQRGSSRTSAI